LRQFKGVILPVLMIVMMIVFNACRADDEQLQQVKIADPFINLHTGPGSAYPIFHVIKRGTLVTIIRRQTSWFEIQAEDGKSGWASRDEMQLTLLPDGQPFVVTDLDEDSFRNRDWSFGLSGGEFQKAAIVSIFAGYTFTENLAIELNFSDSPGNVSSSTLVKANLIMQPFPEWTLSPFFSLGVGRIETTPSATLVASSTRENTYSQVGLGLHYYLSRRFVFRFEYNEYVILSANNSEDNNEEIGEWKTGFVVFF
jgi:uncharacterized protein YraI